ncbi:unnamed protein product [Ectocarpus sp. 6 AP-2014]
MENREPVDTSWRKVDGLVVVDVRRFDGQACSSVNSSPDVPACRVLDIRASCCSAERPCWRMFLFFFGGGRGLKYVLCLMALRVSFMIIIASTASTGWPMK